MTREEAIKGLKVLAKDFSGYKPNEEMFDMAIKALEQPECKDAVSRTEAVEALYDWEQMYTWDEHCKEDGGESPYIVSPSSIIKKLPPVTPKQPGWIPCSERLPEEDTEVLISYRYKEGEGDTDHVNIDITSYGTTCFGCREIHTLKEWRQPFDYFHANYEVIAWMPLPAPYRPEGDDKNEG